MAALTREKMRSFERWTYHLFPLAAGTKAWKHAAVGIDLAVGKVKPAAAAADLLMIGIAAETVDATGGEKLLNVNLGTEIEVEWWANAGDITPANFGSFAYFVDDQTVGLAANNCFAGRIWAVDPARGVAVQLLRVDPYVAPVIPLSGGGSGGGSALPPKSSTKHGG